MLPLQVVVQGLKMGAVHMADPAAAAALEQHAVPVAAGVAAQVEKGALRRVDLMHLPGEREFFQLAVNGGQPHGAALLAQSLGKVRRRQRLPLPLLQTPQHRLLLFGGI